MDNFFTDLNPRFFNVFTNRNREINYDLLSLINNNIEANVNNTATREELISWIMQYYTSHPSLVVYDDESGTEEDIKDADLRKIASDKIRYFNQSGWLNDEEDSSFSVKYMVDENAITLLKTMAEITSSRTRQNELYGYVYQIYSSIKNFDLEQAVGITEQIVSATVMLVSRLRGVNSIVKKYLNGLLQDPDITPSEILEKLLVEYNDKVVLKTLQNLRERDNPDMYRAYIKDKLDSIYIQYRGRLISLYIRDKKSGVETAEGIAEADSFFKESFQKVKDTFDNISTLIAILNKNNSRYVSSARSRTNFLLNESGNLEGKITEVLRNISVLDYDDFLEEQDADCFNIFDLGNLDESSLYTAKVRKAPVKNMQAEAHDEVSEEELKKISEAYFKDNEYSAYAINKYVMESMGDKKKIEFKDLKEESRELDSLKHFLVLLYSSNRSVKYKIDFNSVLPSYKKYGILFDNYVIERTDS